jgi:hypothetical protein
MVIDEGGTPPSSGLVAKRSSARATNTSNASELIKKATKATKAINDLRNSLTFSQNTKLALTTLLEDIIDNLKQPRITMTRIETSEATTRTDKAYETQVDIEKTQLDKIQESIIELKALASANTNKINELK